MKMLDDYRPLPFWSWNDKLEKSKLLNQVNWMFKNGMGGFFMHARSGLQTEYLSDEWMGCIEACALEARELDMKAWIYDENGWPSGFAGMKLLEKEEYRDKYLEYNIGRFDETANVNYLLTEQQMLRTSEGREGEYLNLYIRTSTSTADILNPDVVDQFLSLTHEQYKRHFGDEFAEKIEGFFTDEPQYYRWATPYTIMIEHYFREQFHEDILDSLGLLFVEKEGYRQFRYRYWKGMQELMLKNFAEKVYLWCEENGVKLTGHYVEESKLGTQMMCCGGVMPFYEFEHIPGIDWLGIGPKIVGSLPAKQVSSVAMQLNKKRILTESFGCCGWDITPAELKQILGYQYVNGVNMLCHHLIPYSERGNRKYDYPAHYSDVNPWVKDGFKEFNDYFTKLGYLLGEGKQNVKVALLHPIRSTYFDYKRGLEREDFGIGELENKLHQLCDSLSENNIEYHFIDETLMSKYGFVEGDKIGCGACSYDYLILPYVLTMDKNTEMHLRQYCENGGKVLIMGDKPTYCEYELYPYEYLENNCTMEDMVKVQPYRIKRKDTNICSTYRRLEDKEIIYAINMNEEKEEMQIFDMGEHIHSFMKWNILDDSLEQVPLTIRLQPREDIVLIPCEETYKPQKSLKSYEYVLRNDKISWEKNYLVVDKVRYSFDNKKYSTPWPIAALFEKLLKEKYRGTIFFQYEFDVTVLPKDIRLQSENVNVVREWVNGKTLEEKLPAEEDYINSYDIASYIKQGKNAYVVEMQWYEEEAVYYALFGEGVTEALKNCIVYDSELQPIQLEGKFGVYPATGYWEDERTEYVSGNDFYIGKIPEQVSEIVTEGFPFFAEIFSVEREVAFDNAAVILHVPGNYQMAEVKVNGIILPRLLFEKQIDISKVAKVGLNKIEVCYWVSNRNLLGPHHFIHSKYQGATPWMFELSNTWAEDRSDYYHDYYDLRKFYLPPT